MASGLVEPINGYYKSTRENPPYNIMPLVWVDLQSQLGKGPFPFQALVDSGASCCVFASEVRGALGLRHERPLEKRKVRVANGGEISASFFRVRLTFRNELPSHVGPSFSSPSFTYLTVVGFVNSDVLDKDKSKKLYSSRRRPHLVLCLSRTCSQ